MPKLPLATLEAQPFLCSTTDFFAANAGTPETSVAAEPLCDKKSGPRRAVLRLLTWRDVRTWNGNVGGQMVVNACDMGTQEQTSTHEKAREISESFVVEMRRLELLTPYMRSKCSTS